MKRKININNVYKVLIVILAVVAILLGFLLYRNNSKYVLANENDYNMAFYNLVEYVQNVKNYLAKSVISKSSEHGAETLTNVWREANLAQVYVSMLPLKSQELENTERFLNQVSEYSYSLSRKNINNEHLSEDDLKNLRDMYNYSVDLANTLSQLSDEINKGNISWKELKGDAKMAFAQQVSNISQDSFSNIEENFHEYSGLIYDGAYSDHITNVEKKGLTGEEIDENRAKELIKNFINESKIKNIESMGVSNDADLPSYMFNVKDENENVITIALSKKGGHLVYLNSNRDVGEEKITQEQANEFGKRFLDEKGFPNMKETYYLKENGMVTVNYAYQQNNVVVYSDLIKIKIALDDGEILGVETTGYLNSHYERDLSNINISKEEARKKINKDLQITNDGLAIIPTEWKTEILCYEFKGKVDNIDFLAYINAENGKEEDILIITNTPNGTLTN